jgi:hypothetical protein
MGGVEGLSGGVLEWCSDGAVQFAGLRQRRHADPFPLTPSWVGEIFGRALSLVFVPQSHDRTGWICSRTSDSHVLPAPVCIASVCTSRANVPYFHE